MTPAELKPLVDAKGGVEKFARRLRVTPRTVYRWLDGTRLVSAPMERLIRLLR